MILEDRLYSKLKFIAQIILPAIGTLYFTIAGIWGLPFAEEIVGTISAIDVFLGGLLQVSSKNYYINNTQLENLSEISDDIE